MTRPRRTRETIAGPYLTRREAAEVLRLKESTLRTWATNGRGPGFMRLGEGRSARVRYPASEVARFASDPIGYRQPAALKRSRRTFEMPASWRRRWAKTKTPAARRCGAMKEKQGC
jgi:hypothetical protein